MNYQELINTNIKNLRLSHNLTQESFAEKIGISVQGLSNIERNKYQPSGDTVDRICSAFNMHPIELLLCGDKISNETLISDIIAKLKLCNNKQLVQISDIISVLLK